MLFRVQRAVAVRIVRNIQNTVWMDRIRLRCVMRKVPVGTKIYIYIYISYVYWTVHNLDS